MKNLTPAQLAAASEILKRTTSLRTPVTLYKRNDPGLALFRTQALNMFQSAVVAKVTNKPRPKRLQTWLDGWASDAPGGIGEDITALFKAVEES